jgi:hypothetical protein
MWLDRKLDVMRTTFRPALLCASFSVRSSFLLSRTVRISIPKTAVSGFATAKNQIIAGGSYGYQFCPD